MTGPDPVLRSRRVVAPDGVRPAAVHIRGGRIAAVTAPDDVPRATPVMDYNQLVVLPGLVDTHVHVNEPGRTEWEGFETATRAAAAGGVTTLVDMPLNSVPPVTTVAALEAKRAAARGRCRVDVGFWGGVVPGNVAELAPLHAAGVLGFKCFLTPSGVDEFPHVTETELRQALPVLRELGAPLLVHAESPGALDDAAQAPGADGRSYAAYLASRPAAAEEQAIELLLRLCRETGARVHVVHLSAAGALPLIRRAKKERLPLSVETCPHYLYFAAEEVPDGATEYKCAPPIRDAANRDRLWQALGDGEIDLVASDHSPCPPELKASDDGDFFRTWGGIASLQLGLAAVWACARDRGFGVEAPARWMSEGPARLAGLRARKGGIAPGRDADLVVWDPDAVATVDATRLEHRHPLTPYAGRRLPGVVKATYLRGEKIYEDGRFLGGAQGILLGAAGRRCVDS